MIAPYVPPAGTPVVSPQAAYIVTDILAGNTNPNVNPFWGKFAIDSPDGRRPATLKTGTNNDAKDLNAYGYIAAPSKAARADGAYALAVGVWAGNSDNTPVGQVFSIEVTTYMWQGFLEEAPRPGRSRGSRGRDGLTRVAIDPWTGPARRQGRRRPSTNGSSTAPQPKHPLVAEHVRRRRAPDAGRRVREPYDNWMKADRDWIRRAEKGPGTAGGPERTRTAYFYNPAFHPYGRSWGAARGRRGLRAEPEPEPVLHPAADPGCQRRDPVARGADAGRHRARSPRPFCPPASPTPVPVGGAAADPPSRRRRPNRRRHRRPRRRRNPTPTPTPTPPPEPPAPPPPAA